MKQTLDHLLAGGDLTQDAAADLLRALTDAEVPDAVKGALLAALRAKGETADELRGMALAMRDAAVPLHADGPLVDTCGTGGDGSHSINISTAASLVVAALGHRVVKHGNRSVSSRSGSADVLEALGVRLPGDAEACGAQLDHAGWTFLFAPVFHPSMKAVVPVRRAMKVRTAFNMLGPLTNPARPGFQLLGAFSEDAARLMAHTLMGMGVQRAFVVHGSPGWDEATPCGPFTRLDVTAAGVQEEVLYPEAWGIRPCAPEDLAGGDAADNAEALLAVFRGEPGPHAEAVVLNAALVLELLGHERDEAVGQARSALADGAVLGLLERLR